jgi:drug/metabolite transporter (DMT)-like permease
VFAEPVTVTQIVGAVIIVAGIVCLAFAEGDEKASVTDVTVGSHRSH